MPTSPPAARAAGVFAFIALLLVFPGSPARAEWTAINLHPANAPRGSFLFGVADGQQVGVRYRDEDGVALAALWSGTAASYVDLNPPQTLSLAYGVSQGKQVGGLYSEGDAVLWSGTANSYVNLHPAGTFLSEARGIRGNQQVGWVILTEQGGGGDTHASLWSGTAQSWVDLNPAGAVRSVAFGVDGNQQVGQATVGDHGHASLWTGTAASWVDLEPVTQPGNFEIIVSSANAVHDGQQAGTVTFDVAGSVVHHAGYWNGTRESWVDLNPDPTFLFTQSQAHGVFGGYQVGQASTRNGDGSDHAAFWHGTGDSWVDLESYLPDHYIGSIAYGVWTDGETIYVAGGAYNNTLSRSEAILWTNAVPEPASTVALACAALWALGGRRHRRRHA